MGDRLAVEITLDQLGDVTEFFRNTQLLHLLHYGPKLAELHSVVVRLQVLLNHQQIVTLGDFTFRDLTRGLARTFFQIRNLAAEIARQRIVQLFGDLQLPS